jgi:hypothetical protein
MVDMGQVGCFEHRDVAEELDKLRTFYLEYRDKVDGVVWQCGCRPYSSNPNDYCKEHRLKLGSLTQRIYAITEYLNDLVSEIKP